MTTAPRVPRALVEEFARQPGMCQRLLALHIPADDGRCRGCTTPGTGTPAGHWPCSLHTLAADALALPPLGAITRGHRPPQAAVP